jgi:hypothetical protein
MHYEMEATFVLSDHVQATINSLVTSGRKIGLMEGTNTVEELLEMMLQIRTLGPGRLIQ